MVDTSISVLSTGQPGYRAPPGAVPAGYMGYAGAGGMKMNKKGKMKKVKGVKVGKKPKISKLGASFRLHFCRFLNSF